MPSIDNYVNSISNSVVKFIGGDHVEELYEYITKDQIKNIIYLHKQEDDMSLDLETYDLICEEVFIMAQNSIIASLASQGYLDCAWDDDINDMVFWVANSDENQT